VKKLAAPIQRIAYTPAEAAAACGTGPDFFDAHIAPLLEPIRIGSKRLYRVADIDKVLAGLAEAPISEQVG
jgi:hypothetical protein